MAQNRSERQQGQNPSTPVLVEMLRQGDEAGKEDSADKEDGKMPAFWRVFGGTLLSITAMLAVTAYNSLSSGLADIRGEMTALGNEVHKEVTRLAEARGELVKKEEAASQIQSIWTSLKELQEDRKELTTVKERCAALMASHKRGEEQHRVLAADLQGLREQRIQHEERRALAVELAVLRERLAGLEGKDGTPAKVNHD